MKKTSIRHISTVLQGGLILENDIFIPGGYYSPQGELVKMKELEQNSPYPRKSWKERRQENIVKKQALYKEYTNRITETNAYYRQGKRLLILDYEYEPDEEMHINHSVHEAENKGVFAIMSIANRILGCNDSYYAYYKITCNYSGVVNTNKINEILVNENPDYIWIIGFDLFNRIPLINGRGPDLETPNGFAQTYTIWDANNSRSILTLPMPHPKTPGFDSEVEKIWHTVLVDLFKQ